MTRADKARRIVEILDHLYPEVPIPLDHTDPFTLLVAVVLSAQTTDKKVNQITPALFAEAGTPAKMAALPVTRIHQLIREVGLAPQKAKNLSGLANLLVTEHGSVVPRTFEELEALPGVGHKTASVVMAQAFGVPAFPVDTHILRLAERWGLSDGSSVTKTEADLKKTFAEELWNGLHLRIIFFGREHCPALRHDMLHCPICSWAAKKTTAKKSAPKPKPKAKRTARKRHAT
jgi:endonuclease-3